MSSRPRLRLVASNDTHQIPKRPPIISQRSARLREYALWMYTSTIVLFLVVFYMEVNILLGHQFSTLKIITMGIIAGTAVTVSLIVYVHIKKCTR